MFHKCSMCGKVWDSRVDFLDDPYVDVIGYQVSFIELEEGAFLFNHQCGTSMSISASNFSDMYDGPIFKEKKVGSEECPENCINEQNLDPCPVHCECAYVREVLQIVKQWPKNFINNQAV